MSIVWFYGDLFQLFTVEWQARHVQAIKEKMNALNNFGSHIIWLWSIKLSLNPCFERLVRIQIHSLPQLEHLLLCVKFKCQWKR